jgi:MFS superfamily sulfate permease-like transporter
MTSWRSVLPIAQWLPGYQAASLKFDLIAGATLAAYAVPVSMAYASLAGVIVFRPESSLLYFNADHIRQVVWARFEATPQLRLVVCDLSASPILDMAGARMLAGLHVDLAKREVQLRIVEAHATVRDLLRAVKLEERVGYLGRHMSVEQAILEWQQSSGHKHETSQL